MNMVLLVVCIGVTMFIFQAIYFVTCVKWLASRKKNRDKEFALLDAERAKLIDLQYRLKEDVAQAKKLSDETLKKLKILGAEAHAEWEDVTKKINEILIEVDNHSEKLLENNISQLNLQKMALEKSVREASKINEQIAVSSVKAHKLLRLFDTTLPADDFYKEMQTNKYADAKRMLCDGVEASVISKKLGISLGEVVTLSSFI